MNVEAFYIETLKSASMSLVKACKGTPIITSVDLGLLPERTEIGKNMCLNLGRAKYYRAYFGASQWNRMFTFSFVRNPWSRAVALWHYLTDGGKGITFEGFVNKLCQMKEIGVSDYTGLDLVRKLHVVSQWYNLSDDERLIVNFVGKIEDGIDAGFAKVCSTLGVPPKSVPLVNKGNYDKAWQDFYTVKTKRLIGNVYADDIDHFGYPVW